MHEHPMTQQIIRLAGDAARREGAARVSGIHLIVGDDSGVAFDCVALYFDLIAEGALCEGARLTAERVRPMLRCRRCGRLFERRPFRFECECGGDGAPTGVGREFEIRSIEVE